MKSLEKMSDDAIQALIAKLSAEVSARNRVNKETPQVVKLIESLDKACKALEVQPASILGIMVKEAMGEEFEIYKRRGRKSSSAPAAPRATRRSNKA